MKPAIETGSATWLAVVAHVEQRLATQRTQLEQLDLPPDMTAAVRGRIAELKNLLALAKPAPAQPADDSGPGY